MTREGFSLRVSSYAGYRSEQEPISFQLGTKVVQVTEVIDRWLAPTHRYFKIRGEDQAIYILRHDTEQDRWEMTLFDANNHPDRRLSSS